MALTDTDVLILANGTNNLFLANTESIVGGTGNDAVTMLGAVDSDNVIDLNAGFDRLKLADGANGVTVREIESVIGGTGADTVTLNAQQNTGLISAWARTGWRSPMARTPSRSWASRR